MAAALFFVALAERNLAIGTCPPQADWKLMLYVLLNTAVQNIFRGLANCFGRI